MRTVPRKADTPHLATKDALEKSLLFQSRLEREGCKGFKQRSAAFNGTRVQIQYKGGVTPSDASAQCAKENIPATKHPDV
jgi:hypothetical protein